jgi:hypothetical protein
MAEAKSAVLSAAATPSLFLPAPRDREIVTA